MSCWVLPRTLSLLVYVCVRGGRVRAASINLHFSFFWRREPPADIDTNQLLCNMKPNHPLFELSKGASKYFAFEVLSCSDSEPSRFETTFHHRHDTHITQYAQTNTLCPSILRFFDLILRLFLPMRATAAPCELEREQVRERERGGDVSAYLRTYDTHALKEAVEEEREHLVGLAAS